MMKTRGCSICHGSSSVIRDLMRPHCARLLLHATILLLLLLVACATAVLESTMLVLLVCLLVLVLWSVCVVRLLLLLLVLSMIHEVRLLLLLCDGAAYRVGRRHSSHCCGLLLLRMSVS